MWPSGLLHVREKSGKSIFFKVRELSGNFASCQGILRVLLNIREMSGHFANYHGILGLCHGILGLLLC